MPRLPPPNVVQVASWVYRNRWTVGNRDRVPMARLFQRDTTSGLGSVRHCHLRTERRRSRSSLRSRMPRSTRWRLYRATPRIARSSQGFSDHLLTRVQGTNHEQRARWHGGWLRREPGRLVRGPQPRHRDRAAPSKGSARRRKRAIEGSLGLRHRNGVGVVRGPAMSASGRETNPRMLSFS
jgi:hypothetical protein